MKNNKLIKLFDRKKNSAGYTLTELIIGAGISVVVIGAAGIGLMNLMRGNATSTAEADRRAEVNRALEFISDEVRRAEKIETNPTSDLPSGFSASGKEVVLALDIPPNLGQANPDDKVIYYVRPKPDNTWLGPNVIYRYGPPLDTTGGSYTSNTWVDQALIDRVDDQTFTPSCNGGTAIAAKGFAACVDSDSKVATVYVNGQFSASSSDKYKADIKVYARAKAEDLESKDSTVTFDIIKASGRSRVKIIDSQMGCNSNRDKCSMITEFKQTNGTVIATVNSGESNVNIGTNSPFVVTVTPSTSGVASPYDPYFDSSGTAQTEGEQNNAKSISVEVDLSKDYLTENPVKILENGVDNTIFSLDQVKLLGDKSPFPDIPAWDPDPKNPVFNKLKDILNTENFLDKDGDLQLESNQYLLVFEVGQTDTNHKGFDLQDQIVLITVE